MHPALFIASQLLCQAALMPGSSQKAELFITQLLWKLVSTLQYSSEKAVRVSIQHSPPVVVLLAPCRREGRKARMRNTLLSQKAAKGINGRT